MKKTIFIIATDASRSGAPTLLLNIVRWLKNNSDYNFVFLMQKNGTELLQDYEKLGKVYFWKNIINLGFEKSKYGLFFVKILKKIKLINDEFLAKSFLNKIQKQNNIVLTYCNTATNGYLLMCFGQSLNSKILTHIHEGEKSLQMYNKNNYVDFNFEVSNAFIAVSNSVKQVLISKYCVTKDIKVIPGAVRSNLKPNLDYDLKKSLNINSDKKILLCCGWLDWHKGTDFFMQLAFKISKIRNDIVLIWVGGHENDSVSVQMRYDIQKMNLEHCIKLISNTFNVFDYMQIADIFLMLSRDESFSLVTVEAGLAKKPVLCFDKSGGPCEIVNQDSRFIVPYGDIDFLLNRIIWLIDNQPERKIMGEYLYERVINNYTIDKTAPQILSQIESLI